MKRSFLVDTDILIDYLRGLDRAASFLEKHLGGCFISVMTVTELYSGFKGSRQIRYVDSLVALFDSLPLDADVAKRAGEFRRQFGPSHGMGVADAILAATAEKYGLCLVSRNRKHFGGVSDFLIPY